MAWDSRVLVTKGDDGATGLEIGLGLGVNKKASVTGVVVGGGISWVGVLEGVDWEIGELSLWLQPPIPVSVKNRTTRAKKTE